MDMDLDDLLDEVAGIGNPSSSNRQRPAAVPTTNFTYSDPDPLKKAQST